MSFNPLNQILSLHWQIWHLLLKFWRRKTFTSKHNQNIGSQRQPIHWMDQPEIWWRRQQGQEGNPGNLLPRNTPASSVSSLGSQREIPEGPKEQQSSWEPLFAVDNGPLPGCLTLSLKPTSDILGKKLISAACTQNLALWVKSFKSCFGSSLLLQKE